MMQPTGAFQQAGLNSNMNNMGEVRTPGYHHTMMGSVVLNPLSSSSMASVGGGVPAHTAAAAASPTLLLPPSEDGHFDSILANVTWHLSNLAASINLLKAHHDHDLKRMAANANGKDVGPREQREKPAPAAMVAPHSPGAARGLHSSTGLASFNVHPAASMSMPLELPGLLEEDVPRQMSSQRISLRSPQTLVARPRRSLGGMPGREPTEDDKGMELRLNHMWEVKQDKEKEKEKRDSIAQITMASQRFAFDVFANTVPAPDMARRQGSTDMSTKPGKKRLNCVVDPSSKFGLFWSLFEVGMLAYDVVTIPLQVADMGINEKAVSFSIMQIFTVFFWTLDMIFGFFTGYVDKEGDFELRHKKIVKHYLKGRFTLDLMVVSIEWANFALEASAIQEALQIDSDAPSSIRIVRIFRITRLLKVRKMRHLMAGFLKRVRSNALLTLLGMSRVLLITVIANHIIACGWWAVHNRNSELYSQLDEVGERYAASLHWSLSQLGFGTTTVQPAETGERLYASIVSAFYVCLFAYMLGSVVVGFNKLQALGESSEQEERLRQYLSTHKVSWPLKNRIWTFWEKYKKEQTMYMQEATVHLITRLPNSLSSALRAEVFMPNLTAHPFFGTYAVSDCDKQAMHLVVEMRAIGEVSLGPEHELFTEGNPANHMYFIAQGQLDYCMENAPVGMPVIDDLASVVDSDMGAETAGRLPLKDKDWICEVALWLVWTHNGWAVAKNHSELLTLDAEKFGITFQPLRQAMDYSRRFLEYARGLKENLNDAYCERQKLRSIAQDVFEPMKVFEIHRCKPVPKDGRSEWEPGVGKWHVWHRLWSSQWREGNLENRASLLNTMTSEMKSDCVLLYQTLFAVNHPEGFRALEALKDEEKHHHDMRILFLKRLLISMVVCGLKFTTENNGRRHLNWHYPMAAALCHGSRILMQLHNVPWRDFVTWLFHGGASKADTQARWNWEESGPPPPLYTRRAATHCVRIDQDGYVCEARSRNVAPNHFGLDLPIGGLGNPGPKTPKARGQLFVGPAGVPYYKNGLIQKPKFVSNIQHGHLYLRGDDFGEMTNRQLVRDRLARFDSERSWSSLSTFEKTHAHTAASASTNTEARSLAALSLDDASEADCNLAGPTPSNANARDQRILSGSLPAGHNAFNMRQYTAISSVRTEKDLRRVLLEHDHAELASDIDVMPLLFEVAVRGQELQLMLDSSKNLRVSGWLIHLVIELEEDDGSKKVLVHKGATAARRRLRTQATTQQLREPAVDSIDQASLLSQQLTQQPPVTQQATPPRVSHRPSGKKQLQASFDPTQSMTSQMSIQSLHELERLSWTRREAANIANEMERLSERRQITDKRVVTLLWCKDSMPWTTAVSRYCTEVFDLSPEASDKLIDGIYDPMQASELYMCPASTPETLCHYHKVACGINENASEDRSLPLEYTAVRMKTTIKKEDRSLFNSLLIEDSFFTTDSDVPLSGWEGFGFCKGTAGHITRDWEWMDYRQAVEEGIVGMSRPLESYQLRLEEGHRNLSTILLGIESSAPFKEDFFGEQHGPSGKSKDHSAFGKRKWRDFRKGGQEVPADLGGMHVFIDEGRFKLLREMCERADFCRPSQKMHDWEAITEEKLNFQDILWDSLEEANKKVMKWLSGKAASASSD